jgi:TolB-like protein/thioredoxin-like negative regulator of GroEL
MAPFSLRVTWRELRRRKVVRAGATYALVAWVILQLAEVTFQPLGLPEWAMTWTVLGAVLGLPVVLVIAWFFDVSSSGVRRERGAAGAAGPVFAVVVVLLTVAGFAWWLTGVYRPQDAPRREAAALQAPANAIAVLPFDDMSSARDQAPLADGLAEQLLDTLARSPQLRVASRTSSFAFRNYDEDIRGIGERLQVRWVVEGSVRREGERVRVTAQLIDAGDGYHVWSQTYDRNADDVFRLQDEVAAAIGAQLAQRIGAVSVQAGPHGGTQDSAAMQAYLKGRAAWRKRNQAALAQAEQDFDAAVQADPAFARGWAGLADTYLLQAAAGTRPLDEALSRAEEAAVKAVTLEPTTGECWAAIGHLRMRAGQLDAARRSLEQAVRYDSQYDAAQLWLADVLERQGDYAQQRAVLERAIERSPLDPALVLGLARMQLRAGQFEAARDRLLDVLAIDPSNGFLLRGLAELQLQAGDLAAARDTLAEAETAEPGAPSNSVLDARLLLLLEKFDAAAAAIERLPEDGHERTLLAQELELARGDTRALPALQKWLAQMPASAASEDERHALILAALVAWRTGKIGDAAALLRRAVGNVDRLVDEPDRLAAATLLEAALRADGEIDEAQRLRTVLDTLVPRWLDGAGQLGEVAYLRGAFAAQRGNTEAALAALEDAVAHGFRARWWLLHDPRLATLQAQPRLQALLQRLESEAAALRR